MTQISLLKAMRIIAFVESREVQKTLFEDVLTRSFVIRIINRIYGFLAATQISTWMVVAYGFKSYFFVSVVKHSKPILATGMYVNEIRQIKVVAEWLNEDAVSLVAPSFSLLCPSMKSSIKAVLQIASIITRLKKSYSFMPLCRIVSTIGFYLRFKHELLRQIPKAVLVASAHSPDSLGLRFAAKSLGIPSIFIPHAAIPDSSNGPALDFDLAIIQGQAALDIFKKNGPVSGKVIFSGVPGESTTMSLDKLGHPHLSFGFFLTALTDSYVLKKGLSDIQERFSPKKIIVRPHPLSLVNQPLSKFSSDMVEISKNKNLEADVSSCDVIIVGNSSVLVDVLRLGRPAVYLRNLDAVPDDYYKFVRNSVVPALDSLDQLDLSFLQIFYQKDWMIRFQYYDAGYLKEEALIRQEVQDAVREIIRRS